MPPSEDRDEPARAVAAVVVLYQPASPVVDNVRSYADQVGVVYAVDNSTAADPAVIEAVCALPGVVHVPMGGNLGVAAGLNEGARRAAADGFRWLLTMDQDSTATPGMVARLLGCAAEDPERVGIVSPLHLQVGGKPRTVDQGCREVLTAMTSGNLLSLAVLADVGPFMDELFIDQVDNEMCLRLWRGGYRVLEAGGAVLHHRVGELKRHRFPYPAFSANHSPLRRYYITRNRLWVGRMYAKDHPEYGRWERAQIRKDVVKIVLYEREKARKLTMMWRGWRDYRGGRLGVYGGP